MMYQFDVRVAMEYGVEEAVLLQNIYFWVKHNEVNNTNFHDGRYWTFNSAKAFTEFFPFWNELKIKRMLKKLEEKGALLTGNYNKIPYDRTKWYTLSDKLYSIVNEGLSQSAKLTIEKDKIDRPIPDINTDNKTHLIKTDNKYNVEQSPTEAIFEIVSHLNKITGSNYRTSTIKTQTLIKARMNEGFSVEDFKTVINNKHQEWNTSEMSVYLRPETLFGTKFESYLNQNKGKKNEVTFRIDEQGNKRDEFGLLIL